MGGAVMNLTINANAGAVALAAALLLAGCETPPYRPSSVQMGRDEARQVVLGSISRATWRKRGQEVHVNDVKVNAEGMAFLYQVNELKQVNGLLVPDVYEL